MHEDRRALYADVGRVPRHLSHQLRSGPGAQPTAGHHLGPLSELEPESSEIRSLGEVADGPELVPKSGGYPPDSGTSSWGLRRWRRGWWPVRRVGRLVFVLPGVAAGVE